MTNDSRMPGPAYCAAARPVSTKMPAPMMSPMPSITRRPGPSTRFSECAWAPEASAASDSIDLVVVSEARQDMSRHTLLHNHAPPGGIRRADRCLRHGRDASAASTSPTCARSSPRSPAGSPFSTTPAARRSWAASSIASATTCSPPTCSSAPATACRNRPRRACTRPRCAPRSCSTRRGPTRS